MASYNPKTVKLKAKNAKAGGFLSRANAEEWVLLETTEEVSFSDREGPWLCLRPHRTNNTVEYTIWVHATNDHNYFVVFK